MGTAPITKNSTYTIAEGMIPITKNDDCGVKRTVRVFSADGEEIGHTYPKRARGLVKKGRARYVNGCDIRLVVSEVNEFTEETNMDTNRYPANDQVTEPVNRLYFDAREWSFNKECKNNVGSRSFMQGPDGIIAEAYMIGNWGWDWTEIVSRTLLLPKNTLNTFTFWLNGGENDNSNEICRFEVIFNNDYENRYTYNLNRNFIKPLKKVNGWELYEIPFRTGDNEYTQLKFIAQRAYMTVLNARDISEYSDLADNADPYEQYRPQRHNIVFGDGWPTNTWYSTEKMRAAHGAQDSPISQSGQNHSAAVELGKGSPASADVIGLNSSISGIHSGLEALNNFDFLALRESLKSSLAGNPNLSPNEVEELIADAMESAEDAVSDAIESLNEALEELNESIDSLNETLDEAQG